MVLLQAGILLAAFIVYKLVASFSRERQFRSFAKQHGCQLPPDTSEPWYQRHQRLKRLLALKKTGEDLLDDVLAGDFATATTFVRTQFEGSVMMHTTEPANIQAMLATQFDDFETGIHRYRAFKPILGRTIFSSDGSFWTHSRALFRPQFARDNINDLESTERASEMLIKALGPTDSAGWTEGTKLMPLLFNFTLDTASDFLFGESVESQAAGMVARGLLEKPQSGGESRGAEAVGEQFSRDTSTAGDYLVVRIRLGTLYWLADSIKFRQAVKRIRQFTGYFVKAAVEAVQSPRKPTEGKDNLLARLATQTQDREELSNQTLAILFAGRDTTASLLGWCFLRLSVHPETLENLRETIMSEFPPDGPITFAKLKGCRPLQHFLNEVLRLHPTVPLNNRVASKDTTFPVGGGADRSSPVAIKKGQSIIFSVYFLHRRKDLWGEDALEFKPERWEKRIPAWQYLPFNGGPRICLGQQFALTEASYVLVRVLQHFDRIQPVDQAEMARMRKSLGITMWPGDGVRVRMHKARMGGQDA